MRLCDFGSCVTGHIFVRNVEEKAAAEEIIGKETTPMYRSPEMIDLYMRDILTEKTDIWVRNRNSCVRNEFLTCVCVL